MTVKQRLSQILNVDFKYAGVDYVYQTAQNCDGECKSSGICRCETIENEKITAVRPQEIFNNIKEIITQECHTNSIKNPLDNPVNVYAIGRLIIHHKLDQKELYNIEIISALYGQEIDKIYHQNGQQFADNLAKVFSMNSNTSKIEYLLNLEYGYIPEQFKNLEWEEKQVAIKNIGYVEHQMMVAGKDNCNKPYPLNIEEQPVLCLEDNFNYNLIDGYHRLHEKISKNTPTTTIICGKKRKP